MNNLPQRKLQRLQGYDYSQNGAYFITICTQNRSPLFGDIINDKMILNNAGKMVEERLLNISTNTIFVDKYVVMPDHLHIIVFIRQDGTTQGSSGTTQGSFPTLSEIVQRFKTITTKLYIDGVKNGNYPPFDKKIWQKSFNDHIIRNEKGYQEVWKYIDENLINWKQNEYYD